MKCRISIRRSVRPGCATHTWSVFGHAAPRCGVRVFALLVIAITALPSLTIADELSTRTVEVYDGLATLEIPEHWNEIPPDVLEFFSLQSAESSGGLMVEIYQHGFRPGNPEADFAPPQVLIQIKESGRLNYRQFLDLPPIELVREQGSGQIDGQRGPFLEDLHLNDVFFDREAFAVHVTNTLDLTYEGKVMVKSVSFLTDRGLFTVHCYALISQHVAMNPVFDRILKSVAIDESIRYRPRLGDRRPPTPAMISYAIALFFAVLVLIVLIVQRRRRKT